MAQRDGQRVVYEPLKALSNQKYRELKEEFSDVGLMTGDTVINPNELFSDDDGGVEEHVV